MSNGGSLPPWIMTVAGSDDPVHVSAAEQKPPICAVHNTELVTRISMARVEAGVGGPRPYLVCERCEKEQFQAEMAAATTPMTVSARSMDDAAEIMTAIMFPNRCQKHAVFRPCIRCGEDPIEPQIKPDERAPTGLAIDCDGCGRPLAEPGGLMFSPPDSGTAHAVEKDHLCTHCYWRIKTFIAAMGDKR